MAVLHTTRAIGICAVIFAVSAIPGTILGIAPGLLLGILSCVTADLKMTQ